MDIMELGAIGELVGGVAVIATLVCLAAQVRQNTTTSRSSAYQAAVFSVAEWTRNIGSDGKLALLFRNATEDPDSQTDEEALQFSFLLLALFRNFENVHFQYESGFIDDSKWTPWLARIRGILAQPGARAWWEDQQEAFNASFRTVVAEGSGSVVPTPGPLTRLGSR